MSKKEEAESFNRLGWENFMEGKLDKAKKFASEAQSLFHEINDEVGYYDTQHLMGDINLFQGNLKEAQNNFQSCLPFFKKINYGRLPFTLVGIGITYRHQGDLDQAWDYYQQALTLVQNTRRNALSYVLAQIGELQYQKGELEKSFETLKKSVSIIEEEPDQEDPVFSSFPLFWLVPISIDLGEIDQTKEFVQALYQLTKRSDSHFISQFYRVAKALVLKISPRFRNQVQAEELLREVVEENTAWHWIRVFSLINLCEIFLNEFRLNQDLEGLNDIKSNVKKLEKIAQNNQMHSVLVETYILESKLALLEVDLEKAQQLLDQSQSLAKDKDLKMLQFKITNEQNDFHKQIDKWHQFTKVNATMNERIELAHLEDQILEMTKRKLDLSKGDVLNYVKQAQRIVDEMEID